MMTDDPPAGLMSREWLWLPRIVKETYPMKRSIIIMLVASAILISGIFVAGCTSDTGSTATPAAVSGSAAGTPDTSGQASAGTSEKAAPSGTPPADMQRNGTAPSGTPPEGMAINGTAPRGGPGGMPGNGTALSGEKPTGEKPSGTPPSGTPPSGTPATGS